jgi:tRNA-Thr(GGU) m(6)t(6)A37 methyltransferase TsaA
MLRFSNSNRDADRFVNSFSIASVAIVVAASASAMAAAAGAVWASRKRYQGQIDRLKQLRQEERTGRIRAEVRLRAALKESQQQQHKQRQGGEISCRESEVHGDGLEGGEANLKGAVTKVTTTTATKDGAKTTTMLMRSIGTVASPFVKRMGTPRQPQLVPSARGYVDFHRHLSPSCLDGIEEYSHAWILFEFHANTNLGSSGGGSGGGGGTKIHPPRAPSNVKVGQLASRSPHRPNPIGLSLVGVDRWDAKNRRLHISGLDLVHGTPVYDVKPFVPWDVPGGGSYRPDVDLDHGCGAASRCGVIVQVPTWVSQEDELARVKLTAVADRQLRECVQAGRLAPFYKSDSCALWEQEPDGGDDGDFGKARSLLVEVLRQDPRGSHRGIKDTNRRGSKSSPGADYSLLLGRCRICFAVSPQEGLVTVTRVEGVDLDPDTTAYAEGIPLLMVPTNHNAAPS